MPLFCGNSEQKEGFVHKKGAFYGNSGRDMDSDREREGFERKEGDARMGKNKKAGLSLIDLASLKLHLYKFIVVISLLLCCGIIC